MHMTQLQPYYKYYIEGTKEDAPTIVFVPGVSSGTALFESALPHFLPDFKVLLLNNPGIGGAPMWLTMSVEKLATHVEEILSKLGIKTCFLVGHSMGGFVTQRLLLNGKFAYPKAILMSTSYGGPFTETDLVRVTSHVKDRVSALKATTKEDMKEEGLRMMFSDHFLNEKTAEFEVFRKHYQENLPSESVHMRHFWCGAQFNGYKDAHKINNDTLVIHGNEDHLVHVDGGLLLARQIPHARYLEIKNCGHFPFVEDKMIYGRMKDYLLGAEVGELIEKDEVPHANSNTGNQTWTMLQNIWEGWKK